MLSNKDQQKLLDTGFTLIRGSEQENVIKCKTAERRDWHLIGKDFKTKSALQRAMVAYLKNEKIVEC